MCFGADSVDNVVEEVKADEVPSLQDVLNASRTDKYGLALFMEAFYQEYGSQVDPAISALGNAFSYLNTAPLTDEERAALVVLQKATIKGALEITKVRPELDDVSRQIAVAALEIALAKIS